MKRNTWEFSYPADQLLAAVKIKLAYHKERLDWWTAKKE